MNRGQRRARWQSRFRQSSGEKAVVARASAASVPTGSTHETRQPRRLGAVQLRIGELVLRGFNRGSEGGIAKGLEGELGRVLTERGVPGVWMRAQSLEKATVNKLHIRAGESGCSIGERLAHALYEIPGGGNQ